MNGEEFGRSVVSEEDWSLHRKGHEDQQRHLDKVRDAIRKNLPDLISEENIVMSDGRKVVKIPIRSLDEYKIRYNHSKSQHVGQGKGDSKVGDVLGKDGSGQGQGGKQAGDAPGQDVYEAEVSVAELEEALFQEMELPNLERKEQEDIVTDHITFNDIRKKGLIGNIDKKRTILSALKRNSIGGQKSIAPISNDDLRFKTWDEVKRPESKAVVIAMMDTSASMGTFEKYIARSFFFWLVRFLRTKYQSVEIEFISHQTEAKVVTEEEFFTKAESGGTRCSSAYRLALELIEQKYSPNRFNIYPFHFSDGENLTSDNKECLRLIDELLAMSRMFGYGEVNEHSRYSTLLSAYRSIDDPKFRHYVLKEKSDVYHALKGFFKAGEAVGG
ncbi:sporulation protein YhbH [Bhargavaea ullalensis]|uniref:Sporulation protein YhbH n=1 Tax=Bhargavaea ullalensis TaxID=1265685 RepID=A0ABV2GDI6_9BACL